MSSTVKRIKKRTELRKVLISVPSTDVVHADFMMSLASLVASPLPNVSISLQNVKGCHIDRNRHNSVLGAQKIGATHLLFIDSDMVFEPMMLDSLLEHDVDIVAVNAAKRIPPYPSIAKYVDGTLIEQGQGLVEAGFVGTGVMLVKMKVFDAIRPPWFENFLKTDGEFTSGDYYFSKRARDHGFGLYCDTDIQVGHIGQTTHYPKA